MTSSSDAREVLSGGAALTVSPLARALLEHAEQRSTGSLVLGGRTLLLSSGELTELSAAPDDPSLEGALLQSGRVPAGVLAQHIQTARSTHQSLPRVLLQQGVLSDAELKLTRRALLLDRMTRALMAAGEAPAPVLTPGPATYAPDLMGNVALAPLVLDALSRASTGADGGAIASQLNHRIDWLPGPYDALARAWADLGELPPRPAVSTVLAKRPAAAPRIAALVRAGLARLEEPGRTMSAPPVRPARLPDPPPRPQTATDSPSEHSLHPPRPSVRSPAAQVSQPGSQPPGSSPPSRPGSFRPPRLRLDPGDRQYLAEPLTATALPALSPVKLELDDPLSALERQVGELEQDGASGPERARVFRAIGRIWHERFSCVERAARAFREAASADPSDVVALQHAALHCHYLGERDLAERYAECAVAAATLPIERAAAQRLRALVQRAAGNTERCIEALCEAAADDPSSALPHEQVASLLFERDDANGANAHARLAAATLQEDQPERALGLLAWALALKPNDVPTAYEYASLLDVTGRRAGAAAILAYAAACSTQPEQRRKLRLAAAERAEASRRTALAAQLLVDAFDAEPHFDLLYGPLDEDLASLELSEYRAVTLEDLATACPDDQRAYWLERAARAMLGAPEQRDAALWLLFEAVLTDPLRADALPALRAHAASQPELALFANALAAVIAARSERLPQAAAELLRELSELAETRLHNPQLALGALQQLVILGQGGPELERAFARLRDAAAARNAEADQAERALSAVRDPALRGEACLQLARALPDLPENWARITELLAEGLRLLGPLPALRARLELLYGLRRDAVALAVFLEDQAEVAAESTERVRLLTRLAAVHTVREDTSAVAATCENLLDLDPGCRIAVARLERAARRLGDLRRLARALGLRAGLTRRDDERARVLSQLAQIEEADGKGEEAVAHAWEALRADPDAADSCLLLLRNAHLIAPAEALRALDAIERCIGPSRALLTARAEAAEANKDAALQRRAVQAWTELMPADGEAHGAWLRLCILDGQPGPLLRAAERALDHVQSSEVLDVTRVALDKLSAQNAYEEAALLAWRLLREQGRKDPELAARAVELARSGGNPELLTAALELQAAFSSGDARGAVLAELSQHHLRRLDPAAELRALQRELELRPEHAPALARLHELLLDTGDGPHLIGLVEKLATATTDPEERRRALLELIAISAQRLQDAERAERYVVALVAESTGNPGALREALGALFALGEPRAAITRCLAIADEQDAALANRIYLWCSVTAEQALADRKLALTIAQRATLRWPRFTELLLIVERLTLESDDVTSAMATYDALVAAAVGPHGRRALHYRTGRWLERAGLPDQALDRYLAAFSLAPTGGAPFRALERVARQTRNVERVVPCYERLAEQVRETRARVGLLSKAAELCAEELSDPLRAFELLNRANAFTEHFELDDRVLAAARQVRATSASAGLNVLLRVVDELEQRAAQIWSAEDKARLLVRAALLRSGELQQHAIALARLTEAQTLIESEALPDALATEVAAARAEVEARTERVPTPLPATPPPQDDDDVMMLDLEPEPDDEEIVPGAETEPELELADEDLIPAAEPSAPPPSRARSQSSSAPPVATNRGTGSLPASERSSRRAPRSVPPDPAVAELVDELQAEPWRADVLRALAGGDARSAQREARAARLVLATFDNELPPPRDPEFHPALWRGRSLRDAAGAPLAPELAAMLTDLWHYARVMPRFRGPLTGFGLEERDRITRITVGPVAEAYAQVARTLGATEIPVYAARGNSALPQVLATHPPSVVVGRNAAHDRQTLLYSMAYALWLAQPEHLIVGVLDPIDARDLLDAARLAFAPTPGTRLDIAVTAKELAASLWQSVPSGAQRVLGDALRKHEATLALLEPLRAQVRGAGARAALLASGSVRAAFHTLARNEPELAQLDLSNETGFTAGCQRSPVMADVVRATLSRAYLDTLVQV